MTISVRCSVCNALYQVKDELAGRRFKCRKCHTAVEVSPVASVPATTRTPVASDSIRVFCPACGNGSAASAAVAGRNVRCKKCQHAFCVPAPDSGNARRGLTKPEPVEVKPAPRFDLDDEETVEDYAIELTEAGDPIYRHEYRERGFQVPQHFGKNLEEIQAHIERYIGKVDGVFYEIISDLVHLDVLLSQATDERPYHVLITSGCSDLPMNVSAGYEEFRRAELLMVLPPDWPLGLEAFKDPNKYWPVYWLKMIGQLPHEFQTWIGYGHTIPNEDPPEKIENTDFVGVVLRYPELVDAEFFQLTTRSGNLISFYQLFPLYQEEMDLKLKRGLEELEERFQQREVGFVLDTSRVNVAKQKGWFR